MKEEVLHKAFHAGKRHFFFSVKKAANNKLFLTITESNRKDENNFEKRDILIFSNEIKEFSNILNEVLSSCFQDVLQEEEADYEIST